MHNISLIQENLSRKLQVTDLIFYRNDELDCINVMTKDYYLGSFEDEPTFNEVKSVLDPKTKYLTVMEILNIKNFLTKYPFAIPIL